MTTADQILEEILKQSVATQHAGAGEEEHDLLTGYISESTRKVFSTMCALELTEGHRTTSNDVPPGHEVLSMIRLSGGATATIKLSASRDLILDAASVVLGDRPLNINEDVQDFMGELANMIGGNTKKKIGKPDINLSLPIVEAQVSDQESTAYSVAITWETGDPSVSTQGIEFHVAKV